MSGKNIAILTDENFQREVLESDIPVIVDFWATWCMPCRMFAPTFEQVAEEYEGRVKFGKLDTDANPNISMQYGIRSIPTVGYFKKGQQPKATVGVLSKADFKKMVDSLL